MSELIFNTQTFVEPPHTHMIRMGNTLVPTEPTGASFAQPNFYQTYWNQTAWVNRGKLPPWKYPVAKRWVGQHCTQPMYCKITGQAFHEVELYCGDGSFRCFEFMTAMQHVRSFRFALTSSVHEADAWLKDNTTYYVIAATSANTAMAWIIDPDEATAAALRFEQQPEVTFD